MTELEEKLLVTSSYGYVNVDQGVKIWYRSAGKLGAPTILLLHGFPTSSNMFRNLIPLLASKFRVIAPDIPGFGFTEYPANYEFTFENLTNSIEQFVEALRISKFSIYIFDYGSPVGFRLALRKPSSITGLVTQNGNAYEVGLDDRFWAPIKEYWKHDQEDPKYIQAFTEYLQDEKNVITQYVDGVSDPSSVDPTNYTLDYALLKRPNQEAIQIKLFHDYRTNVELYPEFQRFLREADIPVLVAWGKNDTIFTPEGAESYRADAKRLKVVYYPTGHFALETHVAQIADEITTHIFQNVAH